MNFLRSEKIKFFMLVICSSILTSSILFLLFIHSQKAEAQPQDCVPIPLETGIRGMVLFDGVQCVEFGEGKCLGLGDNAGDCKFGAFKAYIPLRLGSSRANLLLCIR